MRSHWQSRYMLIPRVKTDSVQISQWWCL